MGDILKAWLAWVVLLLLTSSVAAGELEKQLVTRWYTALASINRAEISVLLTDKAKIILSDLDIEQTKAEFIASLDEWENAMKGSTIRHVIEREESGAITAIVCYKFPENETLGREVFTFAAGEIETSLQETVAESCETFPQ